jgi:signal transduction histidine kinase
MKLAQYLQGNLEPILQEWESFARTLLPAAESMNATALRDHARQILIAVATDMQTEQTTGEQKEKSLGQAPEMPGEPESAATIHGGLRHEVGFDLIQLVAEYRALRASVLRLWIRDRDAHDETALEEMTRFNEAIDQAIAESVASYSEELGKARDTFMAILGHDLRSPLSAIVMSAHNAASSQPTPTLARAITIIQRSAVTMQVMIRDLLDFAGSRLGRRMPLSPEPCSLEQTCSAVLVELRAAHPRRTFEYEQAGDLRGQYDPERVAQVLSNLLNNAVNHGDASKSVRMSARGEGDELVVDVANSGKTISPTALQAMLDPVSRMQLAGSEGSSGLGLGLYIAREIADAHGGSVAAASREGQTTFSLRLPRQPARAAASA